MSKELRTISASDGMILTNGEVYGKTVYLGVNDKPENWYEITDAEYRERMAELEKAEVNET